MKVKKIPMRRCVVCGNNFEKKNLLRIVANKEGHVFLDKTGKANGRGAYVCKDIDCFTKKDVKNKLSNALKTRIEDNLYEEIKLCIDKI